MMLGNSPYIYVNNNHFVVGTSSIKVTGWLM